MTAVECLALEALGEAFILVQLVVGARLVRFRFVVKQFAIAQIIATALHFNTHIIVVASGDCWLDPESEGGIVGVDMRRNDGGDDMPTFPRALPRFRWSSRPMILLCLIRNYMIVVGGMFLDIDVHNRVHIESFAC